MSVDWSIVIGLLGAGAAIVMAFVNAWKAKFERKAVRMTTSGERAIQMIETYHDGMLGVNSDLRIIVANRQARFITGYSEDEIVGMHVNDLLPPRFRKAHSVDTKKYMADMRTRLMGRRGQQLYVLTKRGDETHVLLSLTPRDPIDNGPEITVGMQVYDETQKGPVVALPE